MVGQLYPEPSAELAHRRQELAPDMQAAFDVFGRQVFTPPVPWTPRRSS
ncbi:hypothetical protein [Microvirga aerophila]|nr:hypothetical protein [Microvirga aerophila]